MNNKLTAGLVTATLLASSLTNGSAHPSPSCFEDEVIKWDGNAHTICYAMSDLEHEIRQSFPNTTYYDGFKAGWQTYSSLQINASAQGYNAALECIQSGRTLGPTHCID